MVPQAGVLLHEVLTFRKHFKNSDKNSLAGHWDNCSAYYDFKMRYENLPIFLVDFELLEARLLLFSLESFKNFCYKQFLMREGLNC